MSQIAGLDVIRDRSGRWPEFHDAEVLRLLLDRAGPSIRMELIVPAKAEPGEPRYRVDLMFQGIDALKLANFNHQNVVFSITTDRVREEHSATGNVEERLRIGVHSTFGLECGFTCASAAVLRLEKAEPAG